VRDKKEGFIIKAGDVKEIKNKIKYLYDNPKKIEKMGKAARKYVENFLWDDYGRKLGEFYKKS